MNYMYQCLTTIIALLLTGCTDQHNTIYPVDIKEKHMAENIEVVKSDIKGIKDKYNSLEPKPLTSSILSLSSSFYKNYSNSFKLNSLEFKPELKKKFIIDYIQKTVKDEKMAKQIERIINATPPDDVVKLAKQYQKESQMSPKSQFWKKIYQQYIKLHNDGNYSQGIKVAKKAYQYALRNFGEKHTFTIRSINNIASLYQSQGRYPEAEPLYKRCIQLSEEIFGPKHPSTLDYINNLALSYQTQNRHPEAEALYKRCLQITEEVMGPKHPSTLTNISNLAGLYISQGKYHEAEQLYKHCLQIREEVLGPKHIDTIESISNLSDIYLIQGKYSEAESLDKHCLQIREEVLGPKHPDTIISINNLAVVYSSQRRYLEAKILYKRSLSLSEEVFGSKHPHTLSTILNYVICLVNLDQQNMALFYLKKLEYSFLQYTAYTLQYTQKFRVRRKFMGTKLTFQDVLLSLAFQSNDHKIKAFACDVIFRWKCLQEEAETKINRIIQTSQNSKIIQLGQIINDLRRQMNIFDKHVDLNILTTKLEQKELELAKLSKAYQHYLNKAYRNIRDLKLPTQEAVIELKKYERFNFKTNQLEDTRLAAALILPNTQHIILKDLGNVKYIIVLLKQILTEKSQKTIKSASKKLYDRLFGVFDKHIKKAKTIYISPDGLTHKIAFSRLILPDDRFWIERQNICRIQTSRDLLDFAKPINKGNLVAMGGIDYNRFASNQLERYSKITNDYDYKRSMKRTSEKIECFNSLRFSKIEVESIKMFYQLSQQKTPLIFTESNASEYQIKNLADPPHVLHLSTHGFYLKSIEDVMERPMLLSGLALAGSNLGLKGKKGPENEDGILFAIEVAGLNFSGTELVVLSACDTAKGFIDYSEGVYGLLRAFRLAGAHNIIMTLWSLQDQSASDFLISFYKTWLSKSNMTTLKALRQTKLSFIKQNKDSSLWAPYVMVVGNIQ